MQSWGCPRNPIQHIGYRLKTLITNVRWLAKQAYTFRGHDESWSIVLENAPSYAKHISFDIQKKLINILANKVQNKIHKELRESKFCILVDETLDKYDKQQMVIILRCVDYVGYIQEPFFKVVNVMETIAVTLKKKKY
ncbi:hypothetical protein CISIN_1g039240mg, partial [Citrus sinensis]